MENNEQMKIQFSVFDEPIKRVAFTGHRDLEKYADFSAKKLYETIEECIEHGATEFYCGMARGFDLLAAECVLSLKKLYPNIKLAAYVPYEKQYEKMNDEEIARYSHVVKYADKELSKVFFENYVKWCMAYRNDRLADVADVLICFLRKERGGTAYTVKKFIKKKGDRVIRL